MRKIRRMIENLLRQMVHNNKKGLRSKIVMILYTFFSNVFVQTSVSIIGTVVLAILIGNGFYRREYWGTADGYLFWRVCIFYGISLLFITWVNQYSRQKEADTVRFQHAIRKLGETLRVWAEKLHDATLDLVQRKEDGNLSMEDAKTILRQANFQHAAFVICKQLNDFLREAFPDGETCVTIYQRFQSDDGDYCRMIAHSAEYNPESFDTVYPIPAPQDARYGEIEYHTYLFATCERGIKVLANKDKIKEAFKLHQNSEARESKLQQYICIPIAPDGQRSSSLLQIDTPVAGRFGNTEEAVKEFAQNTCYPFTQFLHMIFEESRVVDQVINSKKEVAV